MATQKSSISATIRQNIRQLSLLSSLEDDELDILIKHAKIHSLVEGEALFNEGDDGDFFAIIVDGMIEIQKRGEGTTPITIATLTNGATLGEMSLIDRDTRSASAIAAAPTTVFALSRQSFDTLVFQSPRCGVKLIRKIATILCGIIRKTSDQFADSLES